MTEKVFFFFADAVEVRLSSVLASIFNKIKLIIRYELYSGFSFGIVSLPPSLVLRWTRHKLKVRHLLGARLSVSSKDQ